MPYNFIIKYHSSKSNLIDPLLRILAYKSKIEVNISLLLLL
jgi:hypothetical protein